MSEEIKISDLNKKSWKEKLSHFIYENWQTILVVLVILIIGVSAYNRNQKPVVTTTPTNNKSQEIKSNDNIDSKAEQDAEKQDKKDEKAPVTDDKKTEDKNNTKTDNKNTQNESINKKDNGFEVTAVKGEGVTHLARKATAQYLQNKPDDSLNNLHKIYIEDYLRRRTVNKGIEIGHKEWFSEELIKEAIDASKQLSEQSLNNLKKYTKEV